MKLNSKYRQKYKHLNTVTEFKYKRGLYAWLQIKQ